MRTLFLFLFVVMIGFGYLLSDNIDAQEEIGLLRSQVSRLNDEIRILRNNLNTLNAQVQERDQKIAELSRQNIDLSENLLHAQEELAVYENRVLALEARMKIAEAIDTLFSEYSGALGLFILLPLVPTSMIATYVLVRRNKTPARSGKAIPNGEAKTWVQLTDEEVKEIIRIRRGK